MSDALTTAELYAAAARDTVRARMAATSLDTEQHVAHGFAWVETAVEALRALHAWGARQSGEAEALIVQIGTGETLAQLAGGLPMGQNEFIRPADFGLESHVPALLAAAQGNTPENRAALVALLRDGAAISDALDDDLLDQVRDQYRRFTDARILPHAHGWHLANALIPDDVIAEMAALGTFGVCIPEEFGGLGLGKLVMCIVTEELSRGWIGTGSLGTRSEIAGELIMLGGTDAQRAHWLPRIASGEILPTAVFTEPDTGSDMASLQTRAVRTEKGWEISGAKNWITHAARTDLMTLMARTL
ncbi:MAG TPA: acyl-CoA dehydrogenase family protein, partial [Chakrabartia sp.]|nr:acyl-CoA dehydrogenase family protein [Chakrabartia sp.]